MQAHILIVEDDFATRESLALVLNAEGYVVAEAADGAAALALSHSGLPPQLVILDLLMPGMDGWQFLAARHREPALAAVPVLVLTAARGLDGPELRALGAEDVLEKTATAEDVVAAVRHYCPAAAGRLFYRVGYCPVSFHGDIALATTMLFPGMNRQKGTPEGRLIERSGLPAAEIDRIKARVESQLSMKALADSGDFRLVKWFHDHGVPQVVTIDKDVFKYD
jgi:CheY-like chemotaxis protein